MIGATGGRLDQILSNIYLLALPSLDACDVQLVAGKQAAWLARPGETVIQGAPGDTVSLIPLNGVVSGVVTTDLYYPLDDEDLYFGPARGVSNVMTTTRASVSVQRGGAVDRSDDRTRMIMITVIKQNASGEKVTRVQRRSAGARRDVGLRERAV